jgi:hypothetical protein
VELAPLLQCDVRTRCSHKSDSLLKNEPSWTRMTKIIPEQAWKVNIALYLELSLLPVKRHCVAASQASHCNLPPNDLKRLDCRCSEGNRFQCDCECDIHNREENWREECDSPCRCAAAHDRITSSLLAILSAYRLLQSRFPVHNKSECVGVLSEEYTEIQHLSVTSTCREAVTLGIHRSKQHEAHHIFYYSAPWDWHMCWCDDFLQTSFFKPFIFSPAIPSPIIGIVDNFSTIATYRYTNYPS